jgi:hypothetical protein
MADQDMPEFRPWRELLAIHPSAELFPLLGEKELQEMAEDIVAHGLSNMPMLFIEPDAARLGEDPIPKIGWLIDGRNRLDAMMLGGFHFAAGTQNMQFGVTTLLPRIYTPAGKQIFLNWQFKTADTADPDDVVVSENTRRRHLTTAMKQELLEKLLVRNPARSNRDIASVAQVSPPTVAVVRQREEAKGTIPKVTRTVGRDGRTRTATPAPRKRRVIINYASDNRLRAQVWAQLKRGLIDFASMPAPRDAASIARQRDRGGLVDDKLGSAINWLGEFEAEWTGPKE